MDIFTQKRYLWLTVTLLVVMNIGTITILWLDMPAGKRSPRDHQDPVKEQQRIERLLKKELGFDNQQVGQYLTMRRQQHENVSQLQREIRQIKKQMFDAVLQDDPQPVLSDSLLKLSQDKMAGLERLTFRYLLDLKKMCKPEQQDKLKILIREYFRQNSPRGMKTDGSPSRGKNRNRIETN